MSEFRNIIDFNGDTKNITVGDKVKYIPFVGCDDSLHEYGEVTSWNDKFIFVRYRKQHLSANGQATKEDSLILI